MKKVALVTGSSRGIGLGIVKELAMHGFDIAINGVRPEEDVQDVLQSIKASKHWALISFIVKEMLL